MPAHCSRACGILLGCCTTLSVSRACSPRDPAYMYSTPLQRTDSHSTAAAPTVMHTGLLLSSHVGADRSSSYSFSGDDHRLA
eukprot:scaffold37506_cov35-Phaeocystis_antarctica.AAC.1